MERPQRLLALIAALQSRRQLTASGLAEEFGVSTRTILRDIKVLAEAEVPILAERGRYGGISLLPGAQLATERITESEREVLRLIGVDFVRAGQLGIEAAARSAARKLASKPSKINGAGSQLLALEDVVVFDDTAWFAPEQQIDSSALLNDVRRGQKLGIRYRRSGQATAQELIVDPYGMLSRAGRWYLVAEAQSHPRLFALVRLESWQVLNQARQIPSNQTLHKVVNQLSRSLEQRFEVVISAELDAASEDLARRILGSRLLSVEPSKSAEKLNIRVGYESINGVRHLMQFAEHFEITGPAAARELVSDLAQSMARRHRA